MTNIHKNISRTVTRFAPSPSGYLHLGHAYAALFAWRLAQHTNGQFILRIEDLDKERRSKEFEECIYEDLEWLGISWNKPVMRQSDMSEAYKKAINSLTEMKLLYPCFCTRKDILEEINVSNNAPHKNNSFGPIYPGICRNLENEKRNALIGSGKPYALRLDITKAKHIVGNLTWYDRIRGKQIVQINNIGDVVLARKDIASSYHLAVTIDDAAQGITLINRGNDLFESTHVHRILQALLNLETPEWQHTPLLTDTNGKRLAKRENSLTLRSLRARGIKGTDIWVEAIKNIASSEKSDIGIKF